MKHKRKKNKFVSLTFGNGTCTSRYNHIKIIVRHIFTHYTLQTLKITVRCMHVLRAKNLVVNHVPSDVRMYHN